jgi:hypothetical protein
MMDNLMNSLSKSPYTMIGTSEKKKRKTAIPLSKLRCLLKSLVVTVTYILTNLAVRVLVLELVAMY